MPRAPGQRSIAAQACRVQRGFTLVELLVVIAIIATLVSILVPSLSAVRTQARSAKCQANLHALGRGAAIYQEQENGALVGGRLPRVSGSDCDTSATLFGQQKYRPTFLAMMSSAVSVPPFDDPQACRSTFDLDGERGDRQNYSYPLYVCPEVPDWTDERNGSYGYNYQFLGNSRTVEGGTDTDYKNWPTRIDQFSQPQRTVMVADSMGTAATWAPEDRLPYENNSRDAQRFGNEGFNLDPPWIDVANGEAANFDSNPMSASTAHDRHNGRAVVLFLDQHIELRTLPELGYEVLANGAIGFEGENVLWTGSGRDFPWTPNGVPAAARTRR